MTTEDENLTLTAYKDHNVTVSGGRLLNLEWSKAGG